jgi:hypothetical protein
MITALWETERELNESEARSLTSEEVQMRKARKVAECVARNGMYTRWMGEGARLLHISEMEISNTTRSYEFFWVFPE